MKIWIITSWFEMLPLFQFLNKYDFEYHILWDWNNRPYWDKGFWHSLGKIKEGIQILENKDVDFLILPPIYELYIQNIKKLPIFEKYLLEICLKYSLTGKIGFIWDLSDNEVIKDIFLEITKNYEPTQNQKNIKNFNLPFAIWKKDVMLWKYFLTKLGARNRMLNKTIKFDIKYFKDAAVDTLIPLNWGFLWFEKSIVSNLNFKRTRFHWSKKIETVFKEIIEKKQIEQSKYKIKIHKNWIVTPLIQQKKRTYLLQRWKEVEIDIKDIK